MKCQHCDKQAVFHITELEAGAVRELHLCEDHARSYLNQSEGAGESAAEDEAEGKPAARQGIAGKLEKFPTPGVRTIEDLAKKIGRAHV